MTALRAIVAESRAKANIDHTIAIDTPDGYSVLAEFGAVTPCDIRGTTGNDTLVGTHGNDVICAQEGADLIKARGGDDLILGGPGIDTVSFADAPRGVIANLGKTTATGESSDALSEVENLVGSRFDDKLDGDGGINVLDGGGGSDGL